MRVLLFPLTPYSNLTFDAKWQEYDALPHIGHGCGHNLISSCSLGAALATKAWLEEDARRAGTVKLFGTPVHLLP